MKKLFLLAALLCVPCGYSQKIPDEEYKARHAAAVNALVAIDRSEIALKELENLRSAYYAPLTRHSRQYFQKLGEWQSHWNKVFKGLEINEFSDFEEILKLTQTSLDKQNRIFQDMEVHDSKVRYLYQQIKDNAPDQVKVKGATKSQEEVVKKLNSGISELTQSAQAVYKATREQSGAVRLAIDISQQALEAKMKKALLESGKFPVDKAIKAYKELLEYENTVSPQLLLIEKDSILVSKHALNVAFFKTRKLIAKVRLDCDRVEEAIESSNTSSEYKEKGRKLAKGYCQAAEKSWESLKSSGLDTVEMVEENSALMAKFFERKCRAKDVEIDCERLKVLKSVDRQALKSYTEQELENHELSWDQLYYENQ